MAAFALSGGGLRAFGQHVHLAVGAVSQQQGSQLLLVNGASYDIFSYGGTNSSCFFMSDNEPVLYPGLYQSDVTLVALPLTLWTGGPAPGAAAAGAYIEAVIKSVIGPSGAEFGFWEENVEGSQTSELFTLQAGQSDGTNHFNVSEGVDTSDGPDPFGHIHGRRFTANKPGLYTVGFQFIDTSSAGPEGGPIHTPSKTNYFFFQAGLGIDSITKTNDVVSVKFGTRAFRNYDVESNTNLLGTNWTKVTGIIGANHSDMHLLTDPNATNPACFYRLKETAQ
jgi:hypothetical protein